MNSLQYTEKHSIMALALTGMLLPAFASAQTFEIFDLGTLGGFSAAANAIADDGAAAGWADSTLDQRTPFLKECAECEMQNLGFLPYGTKGSATAISRNGAYVAGYSGINFVFTPPSILGTEVTQAFMWHEGEMQELGAFYNPALVGRRHGHSEAHGVNDHGQVVGFSVILRANAYHAFLWEDGQMIDITPDPTSADITRAFGINNKSQVVGDAAPATMAPVTYPLRSAFMWENGVTQDLVALEGHSSSSARAINEHSEIVGWSGVTGADYSDLVRSHAVLWDSGVIHNLGTLPGDESSQALAINDRGSITGWSGSLADADTRAFLWQCGNMHDLNTLISPAAGWYLIEARGINNDGQIVGIGLKNGELRAYSLSPEPDSQGECPPSQPRPHPGTGNGLTDNPGNGKGPLENPGRGKGLAENQGQGKDRDKGSRPLATGDNTIYSCVKVHHSGRPDSFNLVDEYDIALQVMTEERVLVHVLDFRADITNGATDETGQIYNCSGVFDLQTLQYHDVVQYRGQTFQVLFQLVNEATLEMKLVSLVEL
jgi:probable HAF family extracellular repeat protein